jgi:hypothetical protein
MSGHRRAHHEGELMAFLEGVPVVVALLFVETNSWQQG